MLKEKSNSQFPSIDRILRYRVSSVHKAENEVYAALALAIATIIALVWANIGSSYSAFWSTVAGFNVGGYSLELTLAHWVDEGLMTLFFLAVGLDVRRELALGELRNPSRAVLPIAAAIGGLLVPAGIFLLLSSGTDYAAAWGSVISTDTAFAIGMLALIGPRNAPRLRIFLLTLAVVDDIGALAVIGLFYTDHLNLIALALAALGLLAIWLFQRLDDWRYSWRLMPYIVMGIFTWLALQASGVHPTLAGVLIALLLPVYSPRRRDVEYASVFFRNFRQSPTSHTARTVRNAVEYAVPLNQRLSEALPGYVNFLVVPLFALANAGVALSGGSFTEMLTSGLTWTVIAGLVVGKFVGITAVSAIVQRLLPATRLPGLDLPRILGVAALSGMGFTISLLVVNIAVKDPVELDQARIGVVAASVLALLIAWVIFRIGNRFSPLPPPVGETLHHAVDPGRDHILGSAEAPATLVVYAAMDDTYRNETAEALHDVRTRLGDGVCIVFRHHTETEETMFAAQVLEAAAAQGKFWEMYDALVQSRETIDDSSAEAIAEAIGLNVEKFNKRINNNWDCHRVEDDNLDARSAEFPNTPVLFAQGRRVTAAPNAWHLIEILRKSLGKDQSRREVSEEDNT